MTDAGGSISTKNNSSNYIKFSDKVEEAVYVVCRTFKELFDNPIPESEIYQPIPNDDKYFPFPQERKGQYEAFQKLCDEFIKANNNNSQRIVRLIVRCGHGKESVYLALAAKAAKEFGISTIIITIRNALQEKIVKTYSNRIDIPIFRLFRKEKECKYEKTGCNIIIKIGKERFFIDEKRELHPYPCPGCPYEEKKEELRKILQNEKTAIVALNHGNWSFASKSRGIVIIDEADEAIEDMIPEVPVSKSYGKTLDEVINKLEKDLSILELRLKEKIVRSEFDHEFIKIYNVYIEDYNKYRKLMLLKEISRVVPVVKIEYKDSIKFKAIIMEDKLEDVVKILFPYAKFIVLVSATMLKTKNTIELRPIPFRTKLLYIPIGNMSRKNIDERKRKDLLLRATDFIYKCYEFVNRYAGYSGVLKINSEDIRLVIFCVNGDYTKTVGNRLKENIHEKYIVISENGNFTESYNKFIENRDIKFFVATAAAERGVDLHAPLAFILKLPYDGIDDEEKMQIVKEIGKEKFNKWYNIRALKRIIQISGRNTRDPNDPALVVILDQQFTYLLENLDSKTVENVPVWFKDLLSDMIIYTKLQFN